MHEKLKKVKEFTNRHQLILVAGTSAVVGVVVTRKIDTRIFTNFAYGAGVKAGVLAHHLDMAFTFIEDKGLMAEYEQYGPKFLEKISTVE